MPSTASLEPTPWPIAREILLVEASHISELLLAAASETSYGLSWQQHSVHAELERNPDAGGAVPTWNVYSGDAGIAWFLGEYAAATSSASALAVACQAMRSALARALMVDCRTIGFYTGLTGVSLVAARLAQLSDDATLWEGASEVLQRVDTMLDSDEAYDLISGSAGAVPALLWMATNTALAAAGGIAVRCGEHLLRSAERVSDGWCWPTQLRTVRPLTGYAHGAAGLGLSLFELAAATGDERFRYAGMQAWCYENAQWIPSKGTWEEYREASWSLDRTLATSRSAASTLAPNIAKPMLAWCHGAPGIGLARSRGYALMRHPQHRADADVSMLLTADSLQQRRPQDHSLCHGWFGRSTSLFLAGQQVGNADWCTRAVEASVAQIEKEGGQGKWRSGVPGHASDSSLLLGTAGIGFSMLQMAGAISHGASPVLITPSTCRGAAPQSAMRSEIAALVENDIAYLLPSVCEMRETDAVVSSAIASAVSKPDEAPIRRVLAELATSRWPLTAPHHVNVRFRRDSDCVRLLGELLDLRVDRSERELAKRDVVGTCRWRLSRRVMMTSWQMTLGGESYVETRRQEVSTVAEAFLVVRFGLRVARQRIGTFTFHLLQILSGESLGTCELVAALGRRLHADYDDPRFVAIVMEQLERARVAEIVWCNPDPLKGASEGEEHNWA